MAEINQKTSGIPKAYTLERGNAPAQVGMYIGEVRNNVDSQTRSGRVQVWIEDFAGPDKNNPNLWRTVMPVSPFYGVTNPPAVQQSGAGSYVLNKQSYGMWFTPPDIGTRLVCFFASGDSNFGYYLGAVVEAGINHMLPAVGASPNYQLDNNAQAGYFSNSPRLPVVEINQNNTAIAENPRYWDQTKPVHGVVAATMLQQGLINDPIRGPIGSNAQRESPSTVYGVSTPGRPIYQGGLNEADIRAKLETGQVQPQDANVIARRGGHSIVMDDGDLTGQDQLVRIRTAKGHQITMSDSGDCFYITHANGQTWLEFGAQGTVDVYSSNSINLRSQGDINLHSDRNINMNARGVVQVRGEGAISMEAGFFQATGTDAMLLYSKTFLGIKSDGSVSLDSTKAGTWKGGSNMVLSAGCIALNSGDAPDVPTPSKQTLQNLPDTRFEPNVGWVIKPGQLETVVTRAPTHEPYPFHNRGTPIVVNYTDTDGETSQFAPVVDAKFDTIANTEFTGITAEQYETQSPATESVGNITPDLVTAMLAQSSFNVPQASNLISNQYGVGKYGFSAEQLEAAGYLKPGTVEFYLTDGTATLTEILGSPNVWTGQAGVFDAASLLADPKLQDAVQTDLYQIGLNNLQIEGLARGTEDAAKLAGLVSAAAKYPAVTVQNWVNGTLADSQLVDDINVAVRSGQFAVDLANQKLSEDIKGFSSGTSNATNTTDRTDLETAVDQVIGNPKVPSPDYSGDTAQISLPQDPSRRPSGPDLGISVS